ncbi:MAG: cyclic nucleotide-binding domain-containing protein [Proteobacteria bacterium]|nr:cyclic nucleotide-binding domain-containing protein [Pseudomonadota bacterium]MCP4917313.1 cyclic nucleotide-binding domain-containing protein [Pseudomonadota bacterium]
MNTSDLLVRVPWLAKLGRGTLGDIASDWSSVRLPVGDPLWRQGARASDIAVLVDGQLSVHVDGIQVGEVHAGELVGEAAAFFRQIERSATVKASAFSQAVLLPAGQLAALRAEDSPVYEAILDESNRTMARRIRATSRWISAASSGGLARPGGSPGMLARMWKKVVPGKPRGSAPDLVGLLRLQPGLGQLDDAELRQIARPWKSVAVQEGDVLVLEGDAGDAAWLVADGEVDVLRNVRGDSASRLATLVAGDAFGINALINPGPRTASCVAVSPTWAYKLERSDFEALQGTAGMRWKETILACLATQIRSSNLALTEARKASPSGGRRSQTPEAFQQILKAHGLLEGLPANEESIDLGLQDLLL